MREGRRNIQRKERVVQEPNLQERREQEEVFQEMCRMVQGPSRGGEEEEDKDDKEYDEENFGKENCLLSTP